MKRTHILGHLHLRLSPRSHPQCHKTWATGTSSSQPLPRPSALHHFQGQETPLSRSGRRGIRVSAVETPKQTSGVDEDNLSPLNGACAPSLASLKNELPQSSLKETAAVQSFLGSHSAKGLAREPGNVAATMQNRCKGHVGNASSKELHLS